MEFRDVMAMRYCLPLRNTPEKCVCGTSFPIDHAMSCKRGGYVSQRHNNIRDFMAQKFDQVCNDVCIEPTLRPLTGENLILLSANTSESARLDIKATNFWSSGVRTFFDVRIFHASCPSYIQKPLTTIYHYGGCRNAL